MNFYGHAVIAANYRAEPNFVLGSMLPDFAGMAGVPLRGLQAPSLADGIRFHHTCDRIFHAHPVFTRACAEGSARLTATGLARGPARAVAHVGFEMLLDGVLGADPGPRRAYRDALDGAPVNLAGTDPAAWSRTRDLCGRLSAAPVPEAYTATDFVADRLRIILARRPRLALTDADLPAVRSFCADTRTLVLAAGPALVDDVRQAAVAEFTPDAT